MIDPRMFIPQIKAAVTCRQLLEHNGIRVNRQGFCVCPFHGDRDAEPGEAGEDLGIARAAAVAHLRERLGEARLGGVAAVGEEVDGAAGDVGGDLHPGDRADALRGRRGGEARGAGHRVVVGEDGGGEPGLSGERGEALGGVCAVGEVGMAVQVDHAG